MAALFLGGFTYIAWAARPISSETQGIITDALPSTVRLASARTALRQLDAALSHELLARMEGRPLNRARVDAHRGKIDHLLSSYAKPQFYPGEAVRYEKVRSDLTKLDEQLGIFLTLLAGSDVQKAYSFENGPWRSASDRVDDSLHCFPFSISSTSANTPPILITRGGDR